jgi:hypothetical protein
VRLSHQASHRGMAERLGASLYERLLAEVLAVEVQQIEGVQDDAVGSDSHSRLKRLEVRTAIAIR